MADPPSHANLHNKRPYTGWSDDEVERFFEGVILFDCDHQKTSNRIGTKTYDQVSEPFAPCPTTICDFMFFLLNVIFFLYCTGATLLL